MSDVLSQALAWPYWPVFLFAIVAGVAISKWVTWKRRAVRMPTMMSLDTATILGLHTGVQGTDRCPNCGHSFGRHLMVVLAARKPQEQSLEPWCPQKGCECHLYLQPPGGPVPKDVEPLFPEPQPTDDGGRYDPNR